MYANNQIGISFFIENRLTHEKIKNKIITQKLKLYNNICIRTMWSAFFDWMYCVGFFIRSYTTCNIRMVQNRYQQKKIKLMILFRVRSIINFFNASIFVGFSNLKYHSIKRTWTLRYLSWDKTFLKFVYPYKQINVQWNFDKLSVQLSISRRNFSRPAF